MTNALTLAGRGVFYFLCLGVAAYSLLGYGLLPLGSLVHPDMKPGFVNQPIGVYVHVFAASTALLFGPFQFSEKLRRSRTVLHRGMGKVYLGVGVLIGGLSGLYLARYAFGGPGARLGFTFLALCWLYTGLRAYLAVRSGAISEHRKWMVRNFALTLAAVTLRLYIPVSVLLGIDFASAYAAIAWLCWIPNLAIAEGVNKMAPPELPD